MRKCKIFAVISLLFAGEIFSFAGPADFSNDKIVQRVAPVCDPHWYLNVGGNGEFNTDATDFQNASVITAPGGVRVGQVKAHDFNDFYDLAFYSVEAELGYVLTDRIELFGQFRYA